MVAKTKIISRVKTKTVVKYKTPDEVAVSLFISMILMVVFLGFFISKSFDNSDLQDHISKLSDQNVQLALDNSDIQSQLDTIKSGVAGYMSISNLDSTSDRTHFNQPNDHTKRFDNRRLIDRIDGTYVIVRFTDDGDYLSIPNAPIFKSKKEVLAYMNANQYIRLEE